MGGKQTRPIFLELLQIRQPIVAIISITHRITGVLLFLVLPLFLYSLELSLESPEGFESAKGMWSTLPMRLLAVLVLWWFVHHLLAGLRFLLIDIDIGLTKTAAVRSGWAVLVFGLITLLIAGGLML